MFRRTTQLSDRTVLMEPDRAIQPRYSDDVNRKRADVGWRTLHVGYDDRPESLSLWDHSGNDDGITGTEGRACRDE